MMNCNLPQLTGHIVPFGSPEYDLSRQEWNRDIQKYPYVIVYCFSDLDIINAILWARCNCMGIRIRSGGHHYEGYSIGNGILVIDVSELNKIEVNTIVKTVKIQTGARNLQIYKELSKYGYAFPSGGCPTVGAGGVVAGGGIGLSTRYLGLACDSLIELELINFAGKKIIANRNQNYDLFWACQGAGGGNFGVILSYTFSLANPRLETNYISLIQFEWNNNKQTSIDFLKNWQTWLVNLDERMTVEASLYLANGLGKGFFYGSAEEATSLLKPLLNLPDVILKVQYIPFFEAVTIIAENYPASEKFESTGRFVYQKLSLDKIRKLVNILQAPPKGSVFAAFSVYALGGAVKFIFPTESAFYYRKARYILGVQSVWEQSVYASINKKWVHQQFKVIKPLTLGSYVNFPYAKLKNYELAYYGKNVASLRYVKRKYDPYNIFAFPQSIRI